MLHIRVGDGTWVGLVHASSNDVIEYVLLNCADNMIGLEKLGWMFAIFEFMQNRLHKKACFYEKEYVFNVLSFFLSLEISSFRKIKVFL